LSILATDPHDFSLSGAGVVFERLKYYFSFFFSLVAMCFSPYLSSFTLARCVFGDCVTKTKCYDMYMQKIAGCLVSRSTFRRQRRMQRQRVHDAECWREAQPGGQSPGHHGRIETRSLSHGLISILKEIRSSTARVTSLSKL
jgi:hypothetical protein